MKRILVLIAAILLVPVNANAHAGLVSSNPAANTEITVMPSEISLTFTEDLLILGDQKVNSIVLTHYDGAAIELSDIKVEGATLSASVPEAEYQSGIYEVVYKIVSADGHKVSDSFTYSLNAPTLLIAPAPAKNGHGVLPLPIVGAIAIVIAVGGLFALRARQR
jgi:methionine-rich copper-binding protein CopC